MSQHEKFLKECDHTIEKARRDYKPTSIWDEVATSVSEITNTPKLVSFKIIEDNGDHPNDILHKHETKYGLLKDVNGNHKVVMCGMNIQEAKIAKRALNKPGKRCSFEIVDLEA